MIGAGRDSLSTILHSQRTWAEQEGIPIDRDGYVHQLSGNLIEEMSCATRAEFEAGSGGELGVDGARGKMQALHSSSAFACNVFAYWRERDPSRLARALGASKGDWKLSFERTVGTGVRRAIANPDVWGQSDDGSVLAVESKFCEPYRTKRKQPALSSAYRLTRLSSAWRDAGLGRCHEIAAMTHFGAVRWESLDVFQLLKHLLALSKSRRGEASLRYVWFDLNNDDAREHSWEVDKFAGLLDGEGAFAGVTHQEVVAKLREGGVEGHSAYFTYLAACYGI